MEKDTLLANISCPPGFVLADTAKPVKLVSCLEDFGPEAVWSDVIEPCIGMFIVNLSISNSIMNSACVNELLQGISNEILTLKCTRELEI